MNKKQYKPISEGLDSAPGADGVYRLRTDMPAGRSVGHIAKDPRGTMRTRHTDPDNNK